MGYSIASAFCMQVCKPLRLLLLSVRHSLY